MASNGYNTTVTSPTGSWINLVLPSISVGQKLELIELRFCNTSGGSLTGSVKCPLGLIFNRTIDDSDSELAIVQDERRYTSCPNIQVLCNTGGDFVGRFVITNT